MGRNKGKAQVPLAVGSGSETWTLIHPPYLYLGPCSASSSPTFLNHEGITHILSIGKTPKECFPNITYERIPLMDKPDSLIAPSIDIGVKFIDAVRAMGNKVFVHCSAAISRSLTILVGYLMQREGMMLHEALGTVIRLRPTVHPNPGFILQLKKMEIEIFGMGTLSIDQLPLSKSEKLALFSDQRCGLLFLWFGLYALMFTYS
jgi:atypical dual specificity phosphatase